MSLNEYEKALAIMDDDGWGCAITGTPEPRRLPPWQPANNGAGKRIWFLYRTDQTPHKDRWHSGPSGQIIRYASYETALRAARRLNAKDNGITPAQQAFLEAVAWNSLPRYHTLGALHRIAGQLIRNGLLSETRQGEWICYELTTIGRDLLQLSAREGA